MSNELQDQIQSTIEACKFTDSASARRQLEQVAGLGLPPDLLETFFEFIASELVLLPQSDRILACLTRFLESSRSPLAWLGLFERDPASLTILLRMFSTSQNLAEILIRDSESFDLLRLTEGKPVDRGILSDELLAGIQAANNTKSWMRILRDFRNRETLRIAFGDFIQQLPFETTVQQISWVAECALEGAVRAAKTLLDQKQLQPPAQPDGTLVRFCVLALGKLGGQELNYSSDLDLLFVRDDLIPAPAWEKPKHTEQSTDEYFQRLAQQVIRLLSESTPEGFAYRIDMRLRPHGREGALVVSLRDGMHYYDSVGRTWERQAFIKARPVAGDFELGASFLANLEPWIYRRFLMRADITGLAALKRRIEKSAGAAETELAPLPELSSALGLDVKKGFGGIRDIEYTIQFLQLLHGADQPVIQTGSTLQAIHRLEEAGCLTTAERSILDENYRFLRRVEHGLQIMSDRQVHRLPDEIASFGELAWRLSPSEETPLLAGEKLQRELQTRTKKNRQILDHLLHNAFASYDYDEAELANEQSDLILDPEPESEAIQNALNRYGFQDPSAAYRNLQAMSCETVPFLSSRRSRHFLAAIAPKLLEAVANTPSPDRTLTQLSIISDSLGGKAVLWELFSSNPPSMELCVRLCATSPYLTGLLTGNPGMIDELLDSLMLSSLPTHAELAADLDELCRNAQDIAPILTSFKSSMHLRVGVRDILGKSTIRETHEALADIAEICMEQIIRTEFHRLVQKLGMPSATVEGLRQQAELVVLAVGKLGGREPNYHSDIDVIFLYDQEGMTESLVPNRRFEPTTNRHFFNELCQHVIYAATHTGTTGKLYDLDVRLRPLGRSGQLAIHVQDLEDYFESGQGQVWERQTLCKARPIWGSVDGKQAAMQCVRNILKNGIAHEEEAKQIYNHRKSLEQNASSDNLKRGVGGAMDVEFVVQALQMSNLKELPKVLVPGTLEAITHLQEHNVLTSQMAEKLSHHYQTLRTLESAIRLMNLSARHDLPQAPTQLEELAFLLESSGRLDWKAEEIRERCHEIQSDCRAIFEDLFADSNEA
ncbi:MAG: hypothetical protein AB8B50_01800 [Pirellulaceae bacterium]